MAYVASYGIDRSRHRGPNPSGQVVSQRKKPGGSNTPEFELPGREATLRKVGDRLILEPVRRKSLLQVLATMTPLAPGDEFPDVDETLSPLDEDPFGTGATSARQ